MSAEPSGDRTTASLAVVNGLELGEDGPVRRSIGVAGERIAWLAPADRASTAQDREAADHRPPARRWPIVDAEGLVVAPGFIDLQVNGGHGHDLASDPLSMWQLGAGLARHGVTSFLPTIVTGPPGAPDEAMAALRRRPAGYAGAEPLGLHLEGPMLHPDRRGAHPERYLVPPSAGLVERWSREAGVALVTIAPELPGAIEVIELLRARGVVVAGGHTTADAAAAALARAAGMTMITHLFNAMEPLHHREPNLVGLTLGDDRLVAGIIVDGVHVDPMVVDIAWRSKGPAGLVLVSDAVAAMGLPSGRHRFGRRSVTADEAGVRFDDGTLAGSTLTLDVAVRNLISFTGCQATEALATVTTTPASVIGADSRGRLAVDARADMVLLDHDLTVVVTICGGRVLYVREGGRDRVDPSLVAPAG